ncbi:hypothetical protein [Rhizobium mongolense]
MIREAVAAVIELADNHMLSIAANDETSALIERLRKMSRAWLFGNSRNIQSAILT